MSITDELREWGNRWEDTVALEIKEIADRIDEQHAKERIKVYDKGVYDGIDADKDAMGYVKLPVDADGVIIHVGDVMEERSGHTFEVASLMAFGGSDNWLVLSDARNFSSFREPHDLRHHHEPTVEDVLREFAEKITDSQIPNVHPTYEEAIAEYASKLRLAGDGA